VILITVMMIVMMVVEEVVRIDHVGVVMIKKTRI